MAKIMEYSINLNFINELILFFKIIICFVNMETDPRLRYMSPKFCPCRSPTTKMVTNSFGKRNCMPPSGKLCMHTLRCPYSFPFGLGWVHGRREISFHFFHSQCVLIRFPMAFHHIPTICYRLIIYACYFVTIFVDKKVKG